MILSDQQFEEIRQECPCFYYNTGVDESRCTATGEAKCFAARCPFLFWDKVAQKHGVKLGEWVELVGRISRLEANQLERMEGNPKLSNSMEWYSNELKKRDKEIASLSQSLKEVINDRNHWKTLCQQEEKAEVEIKKKAHETIVDLRIQLVRRDKEIQSLQKRLTEINDMIRPIFSISNIPRGSKITSGGSSAGTKTLATNDIEQGKEETIKYHPV